MLVPFANRTAVFFVSYAFPILNLSLLVLSGEILAYLEVWILIIFMFHIFTFIG